MPELVAAEVIVPIVAALLGAVVGVGASHLLRQRKQLTFFIEKSEELTRALRQQHHSITFKVNKKEVHRLNRGAVLVKNTGNTSISNVNFDLVLDGEFGVYLTDVEAEEHRLRNAVKITEKMPGLPIDPIFTVEVPFMNPGELFGIRLFYDRKPARCQVYCRMEGVRTRIKKLEFSRERIELLTESLIDPKRTIFDTLSKMIGMDRLP